MEEKLNPETNRQKNIERFVRVFSIIIGVFLISILIIVKLNKPDFNIWWVVGLGAFILVLTLGMFFAFSIYRKWQKLNEDKNKEIPEPISYEQAVQIVKEQLLTPEYCDEFRGFIQHKTYMAGRDGKSHIMVFQLEPTPYERNPFRFYAMNLHFPKQLWSLIIQQKYNPNEILRVVNSLSLAPAEEPDIERTKVENVLTGTTVETEKKTHKKEENKKEEKPKGDME